MGESKIKTIVIDTNVVISALLFGGAPGELIALWKSGRIQSVVSREIVNEYIRVLAYPKFDLSEEEIHFLLYHEIFPFFEVIRVKSTPVIIEDDPSDDKFIWCAVAGRAGIIISGDQHLLSLESYHQIKILSVSQFLRAMKTSVK